MGEKGECRMMLSKSMLLSCKSLKFSFAADSVRLNLNGGAAGMRAGASMALTTAAMKRVWAIGIFRHFLLNGLGASADNDDDAVLISSCTRLSLVMAVLFEYGSIDGGGGGTQR